MVGWVRSRGRKGGVGAHLTKVSDSTRWPDGRSEVAMAMASIWLGRV